MGFSKLPIPCVFHLFVLLRKGFPPPKSNQIKSHITHHTNHKSHITQTSHNTKITSHKNCITQKLHHTKITSNKNHITQKVHHTKKQITQKSHHTKNGRRP